VKIIKVSELLEKIPYATTETNTHQQTKSDHKKTVTAITVRKLEKELNKMVWC